MFTASKDVQERNILPSRTNARAVSNDPIYSNTDRYTRVVTEYKVLLNHGLDDLNKILGNDTA